MKLEAGFGAFALATSALAAGDWAQWLDRFGWPGAILIGLFLLTIRLGRWLAPFGERWFETNFSMMDGLIEMQRETLAAVHETRDDGKKLYDLHVVGETKFSTVHTNQALAEIARALLQVAEGAGVDVSNEITEALRILAGHAQEVTE